MSQLPKIKMTLPHSRIKNSLSQISDFFSEFGPLSPATHHDRPERSVHMRLYSMNKREFALVFMAFFACFALGIFIGLAGMSYSHLQRKTPQAKYLVLYF